MGSRKRGRWVLVALAVLIVGVVAAGCGGDDDTTSGGSDTGGGNTATAEVQDVELTLPFQDSIVWAGYEIARDRFYEPLGLNVSTNAAEGGSFVIQQLIAGNLDYAVTGTPETIIAAAEGHELVGIANIDSDVFTIAATPDSGVKSVEELKGEALGVTDIGGGEIPLVNAVLASAGLVPNEDVELVVVGPGGPAAARALQTGQVAAYAGAINDFAGIEATGVEFQPILDEEFTNLPNDELVVRREVLDDPETLATVLKIAQGWFEGTLFGNENPDEGLEIVCQMVPEDCRDMDVAQGFFDKTIEIELAPAESGGAHDYAKLKTVVDSIAVKDAPAAANIDLEEVFPNEYAEQIKEAMDGGGS